MAKLKLQELCSFTAWLLVFTITPVRYDQFYTPHTLPRLGKEATRLDAL